MSGEAAMGYRDEREGYRDRDDRPSWKEIDKQRDRSSHRKERADPADAAQKVLRSDYRKKQYMKEAGSIFGKPASPAQDAAGRAVREAAGTPELPAAAKAYLDQFGVPDDWDTLVALLDLPDPDFLELTAARLAALFPARSPAEQRGLVSRLRVLAMSAKDPDLAEVAREALAAFGS
jgi:hypothetical protein